jgi:hypothetical protein
MLVGPTSHALRYLLRKLALQDLGNNLSSRVNNIVQAIREESSTFPRLIFLKEGDHAEVRTIFIRCILRLRE